MKKVEKDLVVLNGTKYALIPFYVAEEYGLEDGGIVEYDRSNPEVLTLRIRKERRPT